MKHFALLLSALLFVGCVYQQVRLSPNSTENDLQRATGLLSGRRATIITNDSTRIKGEQFRFNLDSLTFVHLRSGAPQTMPLPEVNRVIARNPRPYIRKGILYGAITGTLLGTLAATFVAGAVAGCMDCDEPDYGVIYTVGIGSGVLLGAGFGALIGAAHAPVYIVDYTP